MARNYKRRRVQARVAPVPFISMIILMGMMAIGYLWIETVCGALAQQIRKLEARRDALDGEYRREQDRWSAMKAPEHIEQALLRHGLNMALPRGEQVVRLQPSALEGGGYREQPQYANR